MHGDTTTQINTFTISFEYSHNTTCTIARRGRGEDVQATQEMGRSSRKTYLGGADGG